MILGKADSIAYFQLWLPPPHPFFFLTDSCIHYLRPQSVLSPCLWTVPQFVLSFQLEFSGRKQISWRQSGEVQVLLETLGLAMTCQSFSIRFPCQLRAHGEVLKELSLERKSIRNFTSSAFWKGHCEDNENLQANMVWGILAHGLVVRTGLTVGFDGLFQPKWFYDSESKMKFSSSRQSHFLEL